jgi:uncharacterized protein YndB with AHSA1/START domain
MITATDEDRLSETFAALANSTRRAILAHLAEGEATVNQLAEPFELTLPGSTSPIPTMRPRRRTTRGGLDLDRAVPARLGGPLRPDGRLPHTTPTAGKGQANTMTDNNGSSDAVVIERSFDAPVDLIWQMWTDPEHFKAWYGPDGATILVAKMDVRVGGTRLVGMEIQSPDGPMGMWFTGEYRQVVENERLVYTESVSYENGTVSSPSDMAMAEGHPVTTEIRVELEDVDGRTKMVMTHTGIPSDSPGAAGWVMAFDKLAGYVATHSGR